MNGIVSAVNHLHDHFERAHLDIRLPNICFDGNGKPVLIDLDGVCILMNQPSK